MTNIEAKDRVDQVFESIEKAEAKACLQQIINDRSYADLLERFEQKYKPFNVTITAAEVDNLIGPHTDPEKFEIKSEMINPGDTLSKLMFAVLWKNGHINRVNHLIQGVLDRSASEDSDAIVFRQFGKSICDENEPIVDQHVLRAFEVHSIDRPLESAIGKARKRDIYNDKKLVNNYRAWFKEKLGKVPPSERKEFKYLLDKVLFCLGKEIKQHKHHK